MKDERTGLDDADMPAERLREMRERCERATPGPWFVRDEGREGIGIDQAGINNIGSDRFILNEGANGTRADLDFAAHAREDLPAALAEIERLQRERDGAREDADKISGQMVALHAAYDDQVSRIEAKLDAATAEIERLTAELAARVPALFDGPPRTLYQPNGPDGQPEDAGAPADASLEARAEMVKEVLRASGVGLLVTHPSDGPSALQAVVRAVDASRPAAPEVDDDDEPLTRGAGVRTVARLTALFSPSLHPHRRPNALGKIVRRMTSGDIYYDVRHDDGTEAGYERSELIDLTADTSRPGLTEEQAPTPAEMLAACTEEGFGGFGQGFVTGVLAERARLRWLPVVTENQPYIADGKTGNPTEEPCDPESCHGCANEALLRASRGETGPDDQAVCMAAAAKAGWTFDPATGRWTGPSRSDPAVAVEMRQWEADVDAAERAKLSRGETGPAAEPTRAERVAEAQRLRAEARAEAEACAVPMPADLLARYPRSADPPEPDRPADLGPGIGGAPIRVRPTGAPDPRATLRDGDPQKSGGNEQ